MDCAMCGGKGLFQVEDLPVGPRWFCTEKHFAEYAGLPVKESGYYGFEAESFESELERNYFTRFGDKRGGKEWGEYTFSWHNSVGEWKPISEDTAGWDEDDYESFQDEKEYELVHDMLSDSNSELYKLIQNNSWGEDGHELNTNYEVLNEHGEKEHLSLSISWGEPDITTQKIQYYDKEPLHNLEFLAETKKLPPVEKAIDTGIASGATMEGLETLLAAESFSAEKPTVFAMLEYLKYNPSNGVKGIDALPPGEYRVKKGEASKSKLYYGQEMKELKEGDLIMFVAIDRLHYDTNVAFNVPIYEYENNKIEYYDYDGRPTKRGQGRTKDAYFNNALFDSKTSKLPLRDIPLDWVRIRGLGDASFYGHKFMQGFRKWISNAQNKKMVNDEYNRRFGKKLNAEEGEPCPNCKCSHENLKMIDSYNEGGMFWIDMVCQDCGLKGGSYTDDVQWEDEGILQSSPQIAYNTGNPNFGALKCPRCFQRFEKAAESFASWSEHTCEHCGSTDIDYGNNWKCHDCGRYAAEYNRDSKGRFSAKPVITLTTAAIVGFVGAYLWGRRN